MQVLKYQTAPSPITPIHAPFVWRVRGIELDGWVLFHHKSANAADNLVPRFRRLWIFATSWTNLDNQYFSVNTSISVMGRVSGWTLSNSYSLKTPPTSTIGNLTLRTRCQSSKIPTAHLFLYLVDLGTALLTQSSSSSIVFGKRNLPSAMAKTTFKVLQVHNVFGTQIWCNAKLLDN